MTDGAGFYSVISEVFASHETVNTSWRVCARRSEPNTIEGFFGILKRGLRGIYSTWARALGRYVSEFAFRYNNRVALDVNDVERADKIPANPPVTSRRLP